MPEIGVIGGSGLYELDELTDIREEKVETPFGDPSDNVIIGKIGDREVAFLPRHGRGHKLTPSEVPYRANIYALKKLGVKYIVSVSAVGSLKEGIKPGEFLIPSQLYDRTKGIRESTFFGNGIVGHVAVADPYCGELSMQVYKAAIDTGVNVHMGGTYVCIEGPTFSTRSESHTYRHFGFDIIGMTGIPEAKLAREAEIAFANISLVTDYDVWHEEDVSAAKVVETMNKNIGNAKKVLANLLPKIDLKKECSCHDALKFAIQTDLSKITEEEKKQFGVLLEGKL
ncbi:MAG: S-methyl-5'-thioadenosine phosphorylase [Candidatus Muiribacterium halophilum]|uniref:S-methyl-5'-thioadenosine phosphorylase n=1 Tax=Muiribacterium halophilum TaxID=2053465 RepID=A0A2N5ZL00_MUIH1|nr:MAG: S-methyl-5'-thioadenosine phosphorylase [Candidatus Muirbacterium halophilum]